MWYGSVPVRCVVSVTADTVCPTARWSYLSIEGLVVSLMRYCIVVYGSAGKTQLGHLQRLLNFCASVISGRRKYDHISDVLPELRWLTAKIYTGSMA